MSFPSRTMIICFFTITLISCGADPTFNSVQLKEDSVATGKCKSIGVLYSKTFFQERFMGKNIVAIIVLQPWLSNYTASRKDYGKITTTRLESSDYEKLMGDYSVTDYFSRLFSNNIPKSKYIKIQLADNAETAEKIIKYIQSEVSENKGNINDVTHQSYSCLAAFKVSYGFSIKHGEEIGFPHTYRPFIRLIGRVKRADNGQIIWANSIVAFGSKKYVGSDADADRIDKNELISTYKELSNEVIDLSFKSLNSEPLPAMPELIHNTVADFEF